MGRRWRNDLGADEEVTPKAAWLDRRRLLGGGGALMGAGAVGLPRRARADGGGGEAGGEDVLVPNTYEEITTYDNFYDFGAGKSDPEENAGAMKTIPWSVEVAGLVDRPGTYSPEELLGGLVSHDRIYRLRCVEAWSR